MGCTTELSWEPLTGPPLWLSDGQGFDLTLTVNDGQPWPTGTASSIDLASGVFASGVLSADRMSFQYLADPAACAAVPDRSGYVVRLLVPDESSGTSVPWNWMVGEVRRKDPPWLFP